MLVGRAKARWIGVTPELSDEMSNEVLETYLTTVIAFTDRMI